MTITSHRILDCSFSLREVKAMVTAVQQPSAECTTIFTVFSSLRSDNTAQLNVERIPKCSHLRPKVNVLATRQTLSSEPIYQIALGLRYILYRSLWSDIPWSQ